MNSIGDRIKELRRILELNQTEFGNRINLSQSTIGFYENNTRVITDRTIIQICKEYHVEERWLRDGIGEVFVSAADAVLEKLYVQFGLDNIERALISEYLKLSSQNRAAIKDYIMRVAGKVDSIQDKNSLEYAAQIVEDYIK